MKYRNTVCASFVMAAGLITSTTYATPNPATDEEVKTKLKGLYIIQLKDPSAIDNAMATADIPSRGVPASQARYNAQSETNRSYVAQLHAKQRAFISSSSLPEPVYQYGHTFNGVTVKLTDKQLEALKSHPDVLHIWPDEMLTLDTANTPQFLNLTTPGGLHDTGTLGEDVVVGIVDSGINPNHPSFDGTGYSAFGVDQGWNGSCDINTDDTFACNNKLIGAKYFNAGISAALANAGLNFADYEVFSPRDIDGHGSHVAGTAAGNALSNSLVNGQDAGAARGMAPRARVAAYKACWDFVIGGGTRGSCFSSDTSAAIEAAVADGVDVINYSISGSTEFLMTSPAVAFLSATNGGVFVATSAGNDGPGAGTVGMPVPWVTNVGASSYDGNVPSRGVQINTGSLSGTTLIAAEATFTPSISGLPDLTSDIVASIPVEGCSAFTNPSEISGKIALVSRGSCGFTTKIANAEAAGATGVIVYNNQPGGAPFAMGGTISPAPTIPAFMVGNTDGLALAADLTGGQNVNVTFSASIQTQSSVTGNIMADFSSRGPSLADADLLVPDITAPGLQILAANVTGDTFQYLQGTSMSSPHIAGIAALIKEQHPSWSPAAMRSAIMTTARQDVFKEDGSTPGDSLDFGSGHVVPNAAVSPGFIYDANQFDYAGFVCGKDDEVVFIENFMNNATGIAGICGILPDFGYLPGSNFNHPSISVSELGLPEAAIRYATDVTGSESTYTASVVAPTGVDVTVQVFVDGTWVTTNSMTIPADDTVAYRLLLAQNQQAVWDQYAFGSITWSNGTNSVYSPIVVEPVEPPAIDIAAEMVDTFSSANHRIIMPVQFYYDGEIYAQSHGMQEPQQFPGQATQDPDQSFDESDTGLGVHDFQLTASTKAIRFTLQNAQLSDVNADLDLFLFECTGEDSCEEIDSSTTATSNEVITLVQPKSIDDGVSYRVYVHAWNAGSSGVTDYPLNVYQVDTDNGNMRTLIRRAARNGRTASMYMLFRNLAAGKNYLGGVSLVDQDGTDIGFTLIDLSSQ